MLEKLVMAEKGSRIQAYQVDDIIATNQYYIYCPLFPFMYAFISLTEKCTITHFMVVYYYYKTKKSF